MKKRAQNLNAMPESDGDRLEHFPGSYSSAWLGQVGLMSLMRNVCNGPEVTAPDISIRRLCVRFFKSLWRFGWGSFHGILR